MAYPPIIDLFYDANKIHSQYEEKFRRRMVPSDYESTSKLDSFLTADQREVYLLFEYPGDRHALELLAQVIRQLERVAPQEMMFIVEGYENAISSAPRHSLLYIVSEIARRYGVAINGGIRNISFPQTALELFRCCEEIRPPILRKQVIGSLMLAEARTNSRRCGRNIPEAIEALYASWNQGGARVIGLTEMYTATEVVLGMTEEQNEALNNEISLMTQQSDGLRELHDWQVLSQLIDKLSITGLSREQIIGKAILLSAPHDEDGFPDYLRVMKRMLANWPELVGWEELHRCLILGQRDAERFPELCNERAARIGQVLGQVQASLTTSSLRQVISLNPRASFVVVIASRINEKSVRAAFTYGGPSRNAVL